MTIIIIGGGAAGFFAAIHAKETHPDETVLLMEKSRDVLSKVRRSGGGRCNVTHACFDPAQLVTYYPRGQKELRGPFNRFQPKDTMNWFESRGVPLKIEADNRVFPTSDSSDSIVRCLSQTASDLGVILQTQVSVQSVSVDSVTGLFSVQLGSGDTVTARRLILATGSAPSGYHLATQLGHTIIPPVPSLFTFVVADPDLTALMGLSVPNVAVKLPDCGSIVQSGPILITHWGLSGPGIIRLSAWHARPLHECGYQTPLVMNWIPNKTPETCTSDLLIFQTRHPNQLVRTQTPYPTIPDRLWKYLITKWGDHTWKSLAPKTIQKIAQHLTHWRHTVSGKGMFKDEFVTCGGVKRSEIDFKTLESKRCPGLFIIGELLDIDGITGGFNFQNAWTTGFLAGRAPFKSF